MKKTKKMSIRSDVTALTGLAAAVFAVLPLSGQWLPQGYFSWDPAEMGWQGMVMILTPWLLLMLNAAELPPERKILSAMPLMCGYYYCMLGIAPYWKTYLETASLTGRRMTAAIPFSVLITVILLSADALCERMLIRGIERTEPENKPE